MLCVMRVLQHVAHPARLRWARQTAMPGLCKAAFCQSADACDPPCCRNVESLHAQVDEDFSKQVGCAVQSARLRSKKLARCSVSRW